MTLASRIGAFVANPETTAEDRTAARLRILDVVGCFLASMRLGLHEPIAAVLEDGPARRWDGGTASVSGAALHAGTVAHHLDMDDSRGAALVPVAVSLGAALGRSVGEVCDALAAGYDVIAVLNGASEPIERLLLHPPAIFMSVGSAAVAASLSRLPADQAARAVAIASGNAPLAPFESFTSGASVKDLYAGWPARLGIRAAEQAAAGADGDVAILENRWGRLFGIDPAAWPVERRGAIQSVAYKAYSACRAVHPAIAALTKRLDSRPIDLDAIQSITVGTYDYAVAIDAASVRYTPIGARASIAYAVAAYLLDGDLGPAQFTPDRVDDPAIQALADRVTVIEEPGYARPRVRGAWIRIDDEPPVESRTSRWANGAISDEVRGKFDRLGGPADLADWVLGAPDDAPIADLPERIAAAARPGSPREMPQIDAVGTVLDDLIAEGDIADVVSRRFGRGRLAFAVGTSGLAYTLATAAADPRPRREAVAIAAALAPIDPATLEDAEDTALWAVALANAGIRGPARVFEGPRGLQAVLDPLPRFA